jgi:hypothetical protein
VQPFYLNGPRITSATAVRDPEAFLTKNVQTCPARPVKKDEMLFSVAEHALLFGDNPAVP